MNVYYSKSFLADTSQDQRAVVKFRCPRPYAHDRLNGYKFSDTYLPSTHPLSSFFGILQKGVVGEHMLSPLSKSYMSTSELLACLDSHQNKNHDDH